MSDFEQALRADIKRRLENTEFRYNDNSPLYVLNGDTSVLARDTAYIENLIVPDAEDFLHSRREFLDAIVERYAYLYGLLADANSRKELLVRASYEVLGHVFVKFPYYRKNLRKKIAAIQKRFRIAPPADAPEPPVAELCNLRPAGYDFQCYLNKLELYSLVYDPPYTYQNGTTCIGPAENDVTLDCGLGYGGTALLFAFKAGPGGKVYSFEPNPVVRAIGLCNLQMNKQYIGRIEILPYGVSSMTSGNAFLSLEGQSSRVGSRISENAAFTEIQLTSLDKVVADRAMAKVDCIKMDIEGSELAALEGAAETVSRFRPKLAICMYHKPEDLVVIPRFIAGLDGGYKFYLKHHSPVMSETVLYATVE